MLKIIKIDACPTVRLCCLIFCLIISCAQSAQNVSPKYEIACYHFPSYHPTANKNTSFHGKGRSAWELLKNATPRFPGHRQPNVPLWSYTDESDPKDMAQKIADHFINSRAPKLYYADLLTFYSLLKLAEVTHRQNYAAYVDQWIVQFNQEGPKSPITFRNYEMGGLAGAYRFIQGKYPDDPKLFSKHVDLLINKHPRDKLGVFAHPRQPGGKIWVDCLMAVCPFLSMAAVVLDRPELHDESIAQYIGMEEQLFNSEQNLFHQVKNFGPDGCTSTDTWGRGNGWALLGLVELIKYLPNDHPHKQVMIGKLNRIIDALVPLQAESGMWRQNLVTPEAYEETSGTGLILYALAMALNKAWLPDTYKPMAKKAWQGLSQQVDELGAIYNTCVGTRATCRDGLDYFLNRPTKVDDPHAFGPVLLAAVEMARLEK